MSISMVTLLVLLQAEDVCASIRGGIVFYEGSVDSRIYAGETIVDYTLGVSFEFGYVTVNTDEDSDILISGTMKDLWGEEYSIYSSVSQGRGCSDSAYSSTADQACEVITYIRVDGPVDGTSINTSHIFCTRWN